LEIAKAFNAKSLANADSNADITALMKLVGNRSIQYGVVVEEDSLPRTEDGVKPRDGVLMMGTPDQVTAPNQNTISDG
jgi:hypothetical protein